MATLTRLESTKQVIDKLWALPGLKLPLQATKKLELVGPADPVVPSFFRMGTVAQATIACSALSSAYIHQLRHGREEPQSVSVNSRHAVLDFKSESWITLDGKLTPDIWDPLAGVYKTKDGYVRVHTNFPHHRDIMIATLNLPTRPVPSRDQVAEVFKSWSSQEFEDAATHAGGCVSKIRSFDEWDAHPHAVHSAGNPPLSLTKTGEAPVWDVPTKAGDMPLAGVRVLDLTRVIAGPVCGRTLAAHGADVIWVTSPNLPDLPALDIDTSRGKRTVQLDLDNESDLAIFRELLKDADVLLQSYRPGALARRGFGPEALAREYPGIITANLSAYGTDGPWGGRRGFDSLVQAATGFNVTEASVFNSLHTDNQSPIRALPVQALDHAAGHLLALGINAALARRIKEGGSWNVQVSLLGVAYWVRSLGQSPAPFQGDDIPPRSIPHAPEIENLLVDVPVCTTDQAKHGQLGALRHAAGMSETPVRVGTAPHGLNSSQPRWLPREN
ncbi:CoA-transferase family III domain-containing protein [Rhizoctonia solani]|nr:CoA-transferase family III domain-containing protein [Rhizoctonia solani]